MRRSLPDLAGLLPSWQLAMRAERKSPATIQSGRIVPAALHMFM
jgi:hypothetical protein